LLLILSSCNQKYTAKFYTVSTAPLLNTDGLFPTEKTFSAKNDKEAYRKGLEMLIDMEKNNTNNKNVYKEVKIFHKSDKSYIVVTDEERESIEMMLDMSYLKIREMEKRNANNLKIDLRPQYEKIIDNINNKDKYDLKKKP